MARLWMVHEWRRTTQSLARRNCNCNSGSGMTDGCYRGLSPLRAVAVGSEIRAFTLVRGSRLVTLRQQELELTGSYR